MPRSTPERILNPDEAEFAFALDRAVEAGVACVVPNGAPPKPRIIIVHQTVWESVVSDTYTFLCCGGVIGFGYWIGSGLAETFGLVSAILFMGTITARRRVARSIADAHAELDRIEKGQWRR